MLRMSTVELRSRGGEPARTAVVALKARCVDLDGPWRPGGWQEPLRQITVLEIKEIDAPSGIKEPLHWRLLTSLACQTLAQAQRVVRRYTARWWTEEYHKALKSGAGVEDSQLEEGYRLEPLIAVLAAVAVRLLSTKLLARSRPEGSEAASGLRAGSGQIIGKQIWQTQRWLDQSKLFGGGSADGRFYWTQERWAAWLADYLARMAATHLDVRSIRNHERKHKKMW